MKKGHEIKLNVRPILSGLKHKYYYEGPCRFGQGEALQPGFDALMLPQVFEGALEEIKAKLPEEVNLLEPVIIERTDDWDLKEEMFERLSENQENVDLFLIKTAGLGTDDIMFEFAERCKKPLALTPNNCCAMPTYAARLKARGLEYHQALTWEILVQKLKVLRIRKVLAQTRVLLSHRFDSTLCMAGAADSFTNLTEVTEKLGTRFRYVNIHELLDHMSPPVDGGYPTTPGRECPGITEADIEQANVIADGLIADADEVVISREYLLQSILANLNIKKHLEFYDCNAFAAPCPDVCSTRRLDAMKFTFCLNHSLLNEEGIPSACEYDVTAALSMMILMNLSYKSAYMGNTIPLPLEKDGKVVLPPYMLTEEDFKGIDNLENLYMTHHSVPNRKFKGLFAENERIGIRHFAWEQGFGAVLRYDFRKDAGQVITMTRFSPDLKKIFVGKGTIVGGAGLHVDNCNNIVIFRVGDIEKFFDTQCLFGNHLPLVYGDYTKEVAMLGEFLGLEVVRA